MTAISEVRRTCRDCGGEFGFERLVKSRKTRDGVDAICLGCNLAQRRAREARRTAAGGVDPVSEPDPTPAITLRLALEVARRHDVPWPRAWRGCVRWSTRDLPTSDRRSWQAAFADTEEAWRTAYERDGQVIRLFVPEERGAPVASSLVA